jgi:hypothetical protein
VVQRRFDTYGVQREAARTEVQYRHPWVLAVDADEIPDERLVEEIRSIAARDSAPHVAYRMRRKDYFMGRWIKHATLYPSWFIRFYRNASISYGPRAVHEYPTVEGAIGALNGHLIHHSFNKGLGDWWAKHIRYAEFEAQEGLKTSATGERRWRDVCAADPVRRRRALKALSARLPLRPTLRFLYMYFLRLGFMDGRPGLAYCRLLAMYEYMIVLKMREIRRREQGLPL